MSAGDNPFEEPDDEGTVIVPRPGGARRAPAPVPMPPAAPVMSSSPAPLPIPALAPSPILGAAATLIDLGVRLRTSPPPEDVASLRERVIAEMHRFEERLAKMGMAPATVRAAHYAVSATIDDVVLNTPWGSPSIWAHHSLAGTFHNETVGGERFFALLDNAKRNPAGNLALLELMYVCLSIGFFGRFRLRPQGANELARLQAELYQLIRNQRPGAERDLSPAWRGLPVGNKPLHGMVPVWVSLAAGGVLVLLLYIGFVLRLNAYSDQAFGLLARLPPLEPPKAAAPIASGSRLHIFLEPEIREGLVTVTETPAQIEVSILARGMFESGSATIEPRLASILERIGRALHEQPGDVLVAGHTDNVPIRTARFPSNWHLSEARARAAQGLLAASGGDGRRIAAQGFADTRPAADNGTAEGRERNRRIEVIIQKPLPDSAGMAP